MAKRRRAPAKKSRGPRKRRPRSREDNGEDDDDDVDYIVDDEDSPESSHESDASPTDSSPEESFDFGEETSGSDAEIEIEVPASRRRAASKKPGRRPRVPDDDDEEAIWVPRWKASRRRNQKSRVSDLENDDDDEDFLPDEDEEEEVWPIAGKRSRSGRKRAPNSRAEKRKSEVVKPKQRKARKPAAAPARKRRTRTASPSDDDFIEKDSVDGKIKKRKKVRRKERRGSGKSNKRLQVDSESSDSDFVVSNDDSEAQHQSDSDRVVSDDDSVEEDRIMVIQDMTVRRRKRTSSGTRRKRNSDGSDSSDSNYVNSEEEARELKISGTLNQPSKTVRKKRTSLRKHKSDDSDSSDSDYEISEEEERERELGIRETWKQPSKTGRKKKRISLRTTSNRESDASDSLDSDFEITAEEVRELGIRGAMNRSKPKMILAGRKGEQKDKVKESKALEKQVCGVCLSEEQKATIQGVLNCCTHYFCFACIMEWSKVESRCPVCKRRFVTISKSSRSDPGFSLRKAVIRVQKRDQVYQPSEEELRGLLDPYANVVCIVCQQGGDDNLMLLCDICDSSAHTYCVGLGREVPEGNWYCEGCRPTDGGSSSSQIQGTSIDPGTSSSDLFSGVAHTENLSTDIHGNTNSRQSISFSGQPSSLGIDLNVPPRNLSREDRGDASLISGAGSPNFSRRRAMHGLERENLSTNIRGSTNSQQSVPFPGQSSSQGIDLNFPPRHQSGEYHGVASPTSGAGAATLSGRRALQRRIRILLSDSWRSRVDVPPRDVDSDLITSEVGHGVEADRSGGLDPFLTESVTQRHQQNTRHLFRSNANLAPSMYNAGSSFRHVEGAKEQVQSTVKIHLEHLVRDNHLDRAAFKEMERRCTHTILAACGVEHRRSMVAATVEAPAACSHDEPSLMNGCCSSCFAVFIGDAVRRIIMSRT